MRAQDDQNADSLRLLPRLSVVGVSWKLQAWVLGLVTLLFCLGSETILVAQAPGDNKVQNRPTTSFGNSKTDLGGARPLKLGFKSLNPSLDQTKPLASGGGGGWAFNDGRLIGAYDDKWVGAFPLDSDEAGWWFESGEGGLTAPPYSFGSHVVLGFRSGKLSKLVAETGKLDWETTLDTFVSRPLLLQDNVLIAISSAQVLYAINYETGKVLWRYDAGFPSGLLVSGTGAPIIWQNSVIFGIDTGELIAVDKSSGEQLWKVNPAYQPGQFHDVIGELAVVGELLVFARYDGLIGGLDLSTEQRQLVWQAQLPTVTTAKFHNGRYCIGTGNGAVQSFEAATGRLIWTTKVGSAISHITPGEAHFYVSSAAGRISVLEQSTGNLGWHDDLQGSLLNPPMITDKAIYFVTGAKNLYAYALPSAASATGTDQ